MSGTYFTLNQKYNNLKTQEHNGSLVPVPTSSNLATVLLNGNSAGASNINMNSQDITGVGDIVFADGTTQSTSGYTQSFFKTYTTSPQSILLTELRSNYNVTWTGTVGTPTLSLRLPTTSLSTSSFITIYNNSTDADYGVISLNTNVTGRFFGGRFGNGAIQTISLRPLNWVTVAYNPATNTWDVISKSFVNVFESAFTTSFNAINLSLANTLFRITSALGATRTIYLADTTFRPFNKNAYFYIENANGSLLDVTLQLVSDALLTPSTTATFTGLYGSQLNTLFIPPQTTMTILITISGQFVVQQRTSPRQVYNVTYSGTPITTYQNPQYFDTLINLTGSVATQFYLPDPRTSVNTFSLNRSITINNDGGALVTVFATDGVFLGSHGNNAGSIILPESVTYTFFCNGTSWEINERSAGITYQNLGLDLTTPVDYRLRFNYLSATLNISAIVAGSLYYPAPDATQAKLTTSIIRNVGSELIQVSIDTGAFRGKYGNGSTILDLPANTWVELFSNATDYLVINRSIENQYYTVSPLVIATTSIANNLQYINATTYVSSNANGRTLVIADPDTANTLYQQYKLYNNGSFSISLSASSAFTGKYGSGLTTLILPANTWVELQSNGSAGWVVQDRSVDNQFYYPPAFTTASDTTTLATNFQYINAELHLTSTFAGSVSVTLPTVSVAQTINQKYIIYNDNSLLATPNSNPIVLTSTGTSYFRGIYQNNATGATQLSYTLAPNSRVEFYNNGTNWIVTSIGEVGNQLTPIQTPSASNPTVITRPFRKNYIISNAVNGPNQGFRLPAPLASDLGTEIFIRKGWNYPGVSSSFYLDNGSTTAPPSTTNPVYTLLSTIAQPVVASGNVLGNVLGARFAVLQYGYAGTGNIAFVNGSTTCTVTGISTGAVISHYQPIVLSGAPVASVQVNERATTGGIGGDGTYVLTTAWTNPNQTYTFTISDFYAWTQIQ